MFRTILVGVDGSPQSTAALETAIDLAERYQAKLGIIHAFPPVSDLLGNPFYEQLLAARMSNGEQILEAARSLIGDRAAVETQLLEGPPADAIMRVAETEHYDLIVVGSRGQGQLRGLLLGSVSSAVAQRAPCPVLVVHPSCARADA